MTKQPTNEVIFLYKIYNINQLVLPLDLEIKLEEKDIAFALHHLVKSIPEEAFHSFKKEQGTTAYHPRMMWLAVNYQPSYRTINRFRINPHVQKLLQQFFVFFRNQLVQEKEIETDAIFIDGSKC